MVSACTFGRLPGLTRRFCSSRFLRRWALLHTGSGLSLVRGLPYPPSPLNGNLRRGGGGEGSVTFRFANLLRGLELLLCVCWLDKVVLWVHGCVLRISCIQGTVPCIMQNTEVFKSQSWILIFLACTQPVLWSTPHVQENVSNTRASVAHTACLSVELNMHPNRQFPGLFVVRMPSCLHVLPRVMHPFVFPQGGGGHFGYVPPTV